MATSKPTQLVRMDGRTFRVIAGRSVVELLGETNTRAVYGQMRKDVLAEAGIDRMIGDEVKDDGKPLNPGA